MSKEYLPEDWCEKYANVTNVNRDVEQMEQPMNAARCDHKSGVHGTANDTPQWVPCSLVKPIQKIIESMLYHIRSGTIVEPVQKRRPQITFYLKINFPANNFPSTHIPWIKFMDDAFESYDGK